MTPRWVPRPAVIIIHDRQISRHGGRPGLRDATLLDAGLARPLNRHGFGETDPFVLAAAYAFGIAKGHAFVDGNKRTAFVTAVTFLGLNGIGFRSDPLTLVRQVEGLASDAVTEAAFAVWLRSCAASALTS